MIQFVTETGSTSADLLDRLCSGESVPEGTWLVADRQGKGRGRQGRVWVDGEGNFMGSTVVRILPGDPPPATLSFLSAMALIESVREVAGDGLALMLKWPNDLLLGGEKLAGILLERVEENAIVGMGVNLASSPALPDRRTTSLRAHGVEISRNEFADRLATNFATELERWRTYGTEPLFRRWLAAAHPLGTPVNMQDGRGDSVSGRFDGLDPDGALRLRLPDGTTHAIHAGEVMLEEGD